MRQYFTVNLYNSADQHAWQWSGHSILRDYTKIGCQKKPSGIPYYFFPAFFPFPLKKKKALISICWQNV
jgi:hypothetical protein